MTPDWIATLFRLIAESSLRIFVVAVGVGGILLVARVHSVTVRHAAWSAVLAAMLLMPVLPYWTPTITVRLPSQARRVEAVPTAWEAAWAGTEDEFAHAPPFATPEGRSTAATSAPPPVKQQRAAIWPFALAGIYATGLLFLLFRLLIGWLAVRRIVRASVAIDPGVRGSTSSPRPEPVEGRIPDPGLLYQSPAIATPMTTGIFAPKILLPVAWNVWPAEKLRAIVAHEFAHVRRHDPLVALLARLNLCLFWFHPVAWWLEKTLAVTSEHACDDAGVRVMGEKRRYAELLLDMAEAVRHAGGRLSWDGVGVHGTGLLGQRIDRVLRGDLFREVSMRRKIVVALSCAAVIFVVVACRRQAPSAAPLKEDPGFVAQQGANRAKIEVEAAARNMSAVHVAAVEAAVQKNPEDLVARKNLLIFSSPFGVPVPGEKDRWAPRCVQVIGTERCLALRRAQILWLIEHHPDSDGLRGGLGQISPAGGNLNDPAGYAEAKKLWLANTAPASTSLAVLGNAADFLEPADKPVAEQLLLRAQTLDPKGPWPVRLGRLYAAAVAGVVSVFDRRTVAPDEAHGAFAARARQELEKSRDTRLLSEAAWWLTVTHTMQTVTHAEGPQAVDLVALAKSCAERVLAIEPGHVKAHVILVSQRQREAFARMRTAVGDARGAAQYKAVSALPVAERFEFLPRLAADAYMGADYLDSVHKGDEAKAERERARKYAEEALHLAPDFAQSEQFGTAIYAANLVLAGLTFRDGFGVRAGSYLVAASKAPANDELRYALPGPGFQLLGYMLKYGIREPVVEFLERMGKMNAAEGDYFLKAADQIRRGYQPIYYPRERPYYPGTARQ